MNASATDSSSSSTPPPPPDKQPQHKKDAHQHDNDNDSLHSRFQELHLQNGDVLLFNRKCTRMGMDVFAIFLCLMAKRQSPYDHVGLVVNSTQEFADAWNSREVKSENRKKEKEDQPLTGSEEIIFEEKNSEQQLMKKSSQQKEVFVLDANTNGVRLRPLARACRSKLNEEVAVRRLMQVEHHTTQQNRPIITKKEITQNSNLENQNHHHHHFHPLPRNDTIFQQRFNDFLAQHQCCPYKHNIFHYACSILYPPDKQMQMELNEWLGRLHLREKNVLVEMLDFLDVYFPRSVTTTSTTAAATMISASSKKDEEDKSNQNSNSLQFFVMRTLQREYELLQRDEITVTRWIDTAAAAAAAATPGGRGKQNAGFPSSPSSDGGSSGGGEGGGGRVTHRLKQWFIDPISWLVYGYNNTSTGGGRSTKKHVTMIQSQGKEMAVSQGQEGPSIAGTPPPPPPVVPVPVYSPGIFCSELCVTALQHLKLTAPYPAANNFKPADFAEAKSFEDDDDDGNDNVGKGKASSAPSCPKLQLLHGVFLSRPETIYSRRREEEAEQLKLTTTGQEDHQEQHQCLHSVAQGEKVVERGEEGKVAGKDDDGILLPMMENSEERLLNATVALLHRIFVSGSNVTSSSSSTTKTGGLSQGEGGGRRGGSPLSVSDIASSANHLVFPLASIHRLLNIDAFLAEGYTGGNEHQQSISARLKQYLGLWGIVEGQSRENGDTNTKVLTGGEVKNLLRDLFLEHNDQGVVAMGKSKAEKKKKGSESRGGDDKFARTRRIIRRHANAVPMLRYVEQDFSAPNDSTSDLGSDSTSSSSSSALREDRATTWVDQELELTTTTTTDGASTTSSGTTGSNKLPPPSSSGANNLIPTVLPAAHQHLKAPFQYIFPSHFVAQSSWFFFPLKVLVFGYASALVQCCLFDKYWLQELDLMKRLFGVLRGDALSTASSEKGAAKAAAAPTEPLKPRSATSPFHAYFKPAPTNQNINVIGKKSNTPAAIAKRLIGGLNASRASAASASTLNYCLAFHSAHALLVGLIVKGMYTTRPTSVKPSVTYKHFGKQHFESVVETNLHPYYSTNAIYLLSGVGLSFLFAPWEHQMLRQRMSASLGGGVQSLTSAAVHRGSGGIRSLIWDWSKLQRMFSPTRTSSAKKKLQVKLWTTTALLHFPLLATSTALRGVSWVMLYNECLAPLLVVAFPAPKTQKDVVAASTTSSTLEKSQKKRKGTPAVANATYRHVPSLFLPLQDAQQQGAEITARGVDALAPLSSSSAAAAGATRSGSLMFQATVCLACCFLHNCLVFWLELKRYQGIWLLQEEAAGRPTKIASKKMGQSPPPVSAKATTTTTTKTAKPMQRAATTSTFTGGTATSSSRRAVIRRLKVELFLRYQARTMIGGVFVPFTLYGFGHYFL